LKKRGCFIGVFLSLCSLGVEAQGWLVDENTLETNWNLSFQLGTAALLTEIGTMGTVNRNQMNNNPGWALNFQLAKMVLERFDVGADLGFMHLYGNKTNPNAIVFLNQHPVFNVGQPGFQPYPVEYKTNAFSILLFSKYNFINFSSFSKGFINLNLYLKGGLGPLWLSGESNYKEAGFYGITGLPSPLYAIKQNGVPNLLFHAAAGLHYQINKRVFVSAEFSAQTISSSLVNALPNYSGEINRSMTLAEAEQYRNKAFGVTARFMAGCTYFFNFNSTKEKQLRYLPFYHNRYRSYYSRFHTDEKKHMRKSYQPFYTRKLKE